MIVKWCLVLCSLVVHVLCKSHQRAELLAPSVVPSSIPESSFQLPLVTDEREEKEMRPQQWSLLEPRDLTGGTGRRPSRPVRYTGGERLCNGACIEERKCHYHQGITSGSCSNGHVCCVFEKSCGGMSREKVSFFRSPDFPNSHKDTLECSYRIYPNEGTCALRIDFDKFQLKKPKRQKQVEKCVDDVMFIMNSAGGATEGICELESHTAVVEVQPNSSHPIIILFVMQSNEHSWSLRITQVNCKKLKPWKNVPECGRQLMYEPNEYDSADSQLTPMDNSNSHRVEVKQQSVSHGTPYIVNGKDAEIREFPWQVSLQTWSTSAHRCGGSIINERYILTAAHCVFRYAFIPRHKLKVVVGDYIFDTDSDRENEVFEIEKIIVHYNYKPTGSHANDIAVLKLNKTIRFNERTQPICLTGEDFDVYEKTGIVSGWGQMNVTNATKPSRLQKLNVKILGNEECRKMVKERYDESLNKNLTYEETAKLSAMGNTDTQLCGVSKNSTSVCFGDSGGPLVIQNEEDGKYFQAGVVSYGIGRCRTDRQIPGSYTNIQKYLKFIAVATTESS